MLRGYSNKAGLEKTLNDHSMRHYMGRNIIESVRPSAPLIAYVVGSTGGDQILPTQLFSPKKAMNKSVAVVPTFEAMFFMIVGLSLTC